MHQTVSTNIVNEVYMTRRIAIKTKSAVRFYDLPRTDRPLTIVEERLYRTDEKFMVSDKTKAQQFALYDLDGIYPYCVDAFDNPSPDDTMAYIDVTRGNKHTVNKVGGRMMKMIRENMVVILVVGILGYYIVSKLVSG